jgi:hypothetical protein
MRVADTAELDAHRAATLDAFDAAWTTPCDVLTARARQALRCSVRIADANTTHLIGSWRGFYVAPGGRPAGRFIVA